MPDVAFKDLCIDVTAGEGRPEAVASFWGVALEQPLVRHQDGSFHLDGVPAGTWKIDPTHSEVGFSIRHLMISKVKGKFERFDATFVTGEDPLQSSVTASAEVASASAWYASR